MGGLSFDGVVFDADGTLFDTYPPMCTDLKHTMAALGHDFTVEELLEQFTVLYKVEHYLLHLLPAKVYY